jgi:hypothetical protein
MSCRDSCVVVVVQVPYRLPHGLHRRGTHCRIKSAEQCLVAETSYQPRPKAIPEEIKFDIPFWVTPESGLAKVDTSRLFCFNAGISGVPKWSAVELAHTRFRSSA